MKNNIRLGISSCLLGENVRYNGEEKKDPLLIETFGPHVDWVPVCPEVECGLPVPREEMHLVVRFRNNVKHRECLMTASSRRVTEACPLWHVAGSGTLIRPFYDTQMPWYFGNGPLKSDADTLRLVTKHTGLDHTDQLLQWAGKKLSTLERMELSGFIFKCRSPSCGITDVEICDLSGEFSFPGAGLFAGLFMERFPSIPVEDEARLHDQDLRKSFVQQVFPEGRSIY